MHVGLVNIVVLDLVEDFAINGKRFVGFVIRRVAEHMAQSRVTENDHRKRKYADTCRSIHAPTYLHCHQPRRSRSELPFKYNTAPQSDAAGNRMEARATPKKYQRKVTLPTGRHS